MNSHQLEMELQCLTLDMEDILMLLGPSTSG